MSKKLQNCANCQHSNDEKASKLWCHSLITSVYFNEVCARWEWDKVTFKERLHK